MKPRKKRDVLYPPGAVYFKPHGIPMLYLNIVNLTIDEYESVRLGDLENLKHEAAAKQLFKYYIQPQINRRRMHN